MDSNVAAFLACVGGKFVIESRYSDTELAIMRVTLQNTVVDNAQQLFSHYNRTHTTDLF